MPNMLIVLNPAAGRGSAGRRRHELEAMLRQVGADYEIVTTHARGGATELAWQGIERGHETVVAVGGDGTINEVVNGIKGAETATGRRAKLGIIPLGTGSDLIKSLSNFQKFDLATNVARLMNGRTQTIDLGRVQVTNGDTRIFTNAIGMGLDAQVAFESLKIKYVKGLAVYLLAIVRALRNYQAHPMQVQYDHQTIERPLLFVSMANGRCQGAGFWMTPSAMLDDGMLDLCLVDNLNLLKIAQYLPKLLKGTHTTLPEVTMGRARKFRVICSNPVPVATDGEVIATSAREIRVEILPAALEVLV